MPWTDGALFVNPGLSQVLVDTGSLASATYSLVLVATANPPGIEVVLQQTNAAGTVVQRSKVLPVTLALMQLTILKSFTIRNGERIRIINRVAVTGFEVQASLFYWPEVIAWDPS